MVAVPLLLSQGPQGSWCELRNTEMLTIIGCLAFLQRGEALVLTAQQRTSHPGPVVPGTMTTNIKQRKEVPLLSGVCPKEVILGQP
jgi:hypothetical protein